LVRKAERQQAGLIDPAADQLTRLIEEHIEEYRRHLIAKARNEKHISETIRIVMTITSACCCKVLADLQGATTRLEEYVAQRLESGSSHRTINADITATRSSCRWLLSRKRMHEDPTAGLTKLNEDEDPRRQRRPLSDAEAQKLINAAFHSEHAFKHLNGKDRAVMYTLAQRTGLRRKELRSLTPASFDLASSPPTVQVEAANSKRRKRDLLPLPPDVAETMREYLAGRPRQERVWPGPWWQRSAEMLRQDLSVAGIAPLDEDGRVVDFHGQRTTFITGLARAGVAPATAQRLARHSDINLTLGTYTRLEMGDLAAAVGNLPELHMGNSSSTKNGGGVRETKGIGNTESQDPELGRLVAAWPNLSGPIRRAIIALVLPEDGNSQPTKRP
jgi:site-specific recombinase XerC